MCIRDRIFLTETECLRFFFVANKVAALKLDLISAVQVTIMSSVSYMTPTTWLGLYAMSQENAASTKSVAGFSLVFDQHMIHSSRPVSRSATCFRLETLIECGL